MQQAAENLIFCKEAVLALVMCSIIRSVLTTRKSVLGAGTDQ
jgi:hypothetical protein